MTFERDPVSIENTLYKVIGELTIEVAAQETGRKLHYLRHLTNPRKREKLTVVDMIKLDLAHRRKAGGGAPLYEVVGRIMLAADAEVFSDAAAIAAIAAKVIREGGEAHLALFESSQPGAGEKKLLATLRELEESHAVTAQAIAIIQAVIGRAHHPP